MIRLWRKRGKRVLKELHCVLGENNCPQDSLQERPTGLFSALPVRLLPLSMTWCSASSQRFSSSQVITALSEEALKYGNSLKALRMRAGREYNVLIKKSQQTVGEMNSLMFNIIALVTWKIHKVSSSPTISDK